MFWQSPFKEKVGRRESKRRGNGLEVKVGDPVDQVEEAKGSGEKDACVWVYLGDADVQPAVAPGTRAAVFKAAKEARTVFSVQALIAVLFIALLHVCGIVHLDGGGWAWANVHRGCLLWTHKHTYNDSRETQSDNSCGNRPWPFFLPWPRKTCFDDLTTLMIQNAFLKILVILFTHAHTYIYTNMHTYLAVKSLIWQWLFFHQYQFHIVYLDWITLLFSFILFLFVLLSTINSYNLFDLYSYWIFFELLTFQLLEITHYFCTALRLLWLTPVVNIGNSVKRLFFGLRYVYRAAMMGLCAHTVLWWV